MSTQDTQETEQSAPEVGADQAQSLAALQAQAAELEAAAPGTVSVAVPEAVPDPAGEMAGEIAGLLSVAVGFITPVFPSLNEIYTDQNKQAIGAAVAPVMVKHGWNLGSIYGKYAEEITCAAVVVPVGLATYQAINFDIAQRKRAAEEAKNRAREGGSIVEQS